MVKGRGSDGEGGFASKNRTVKRNLGVLICILGVTQLLVLVYIVYLFMVGSQVSGALEERLDRMNTRLERAVRLSNEK